MCPVVLGDGAGGTGRKRSGLGHKMSVGNPLLFVAVVHHKVTAIMTSNVSEPNKFVLVCLCKRNISEPNKLFSVCLCVRL